MAQQLKRWESPRRKGRNTKGKGGSARQRQRRKQMQMLRKKLDAGQPPSSHSSPSSAKLITDKGEVAGSNFPFVCNG